MRRRLAKAMCAAMAAACLWAGAACVPDFKPASQLDETPQVLAVRAEPPEAAPGATVHLDALVHWPGGTPEYLWLVCIPSAADTIDTCVSNRLGDGGVLLPLCASAPGAPLCYASRDATAQYTVPPDLPTAEEGNATVYLELVVGDDTDSDDCVRAYRDLNPSPRCRVALKRLSVSAPASNDNPQLRPLVVDGTSRDATATVPLDPTGAQGEDLEAVLSVSVAPDSVDELAGDPPADEFRLPVAWYATCGKLKPDSGALVCTPPAPGETSPTCEPQEVIWSPAASGDCTVHVTLRDGRGGVDWLTQHFVVGSGG